jgi:hypothetical protein
VDVVNAVVNANFTIVALSTPYLNAYMQECWHPSHIPCDGMRWGSESDAIKIKVMDAIHAITRAHRSSCVIPIPNKAES